ncbi:MAG: ABC transporter permease, partial [Saprospiraceae bacterium]
TNYFKIAFRNIWKNRLYSSINIFGLMVGQAACLLISVFILHELSYDTFHVNKDRIVRATMQIGQAGTESNVVQTGTKPGPHFKRLFPAIEEYVRTYKANRVVKNDTKIFEEPRVLYADPAFFRIFTFPLVKGTLADVLDAPDKVVITESVAKKYFGTTEPFNKTLKIGTKDYLISGICKDAPQNSQIKFDFVTQFLNLGNNVKEEQWWTANWITYFLLKDEKSILPLQQQIAEYMNTAEVKTEAHLGDRDYLHYNLEPLSRVHLYSSLAGFEPNGNIRYIYMFAIIALLIILIACANYTNLATAQSASRSGEIGIRKVLGASPRQVFSQFIGESSAMAGISAILALGLCFLLLPYFNLITGTTFKIIQLLQPKSLLLLASVTLMVSLLAGGYPAMILSGTGIMSVLKMGFNFTGSNSILRKSLIVIQFSISVFLIVFTIVVLKQMKFLKDKDLGYDKAQVLILPIDGKMTENYENIKLAIAGISGVEGITAAYETPEFIEWGDGITATDEKGVHEVSLNALPVDLGFTSTMKMEIVAGRDFQKNDFALMDTNQNNANYQVPFIINESLAKKIGWEPQQSIGRKIEKGFKGPVVGVVKDFNFESLHEPIKPLVLFLSRDLVRTFMVRINGNDVKSVLNRLEVVWKERVPHRPFEYHFLDEDYNKLYIAETRNSALFTIAAVLAILLACLGLFGLAAFATVQRFKEIGLRRVLGAGLGSIMMLISRGFILLVLIALLIAIPLAWYTGHQWLRDFAFHISLTGWIPILVSCLVLLIACMTIGFQVIKATRMNPIKSLRTE